MTSLHTSSWFSLLEGVASPDALVDQAIRLGASSLALTDVNNLYGAVPFVAAARRRGLKPMLGAHLRHAKGEAVALIAEPAGYRSLCRLLSAMHLEETERPLASLLNDQSAGLHLLVRDFGLAAAVREAYAGRVWFECVRPSLGGERNESVLLDEARKQGLPVVASTAAQLAEADDYHAARLAAALRSGLRLDQLPPTLPFGPAHRLVSPTELRRRFRDLPEAVAHAERLAEMLTGDPLPSAPSAPDDPEAYQSLKERCERGLVQRGLARDAEATARLGRELRLIAERRLAPALLLVADIVAFAKRWRHSMSATGSAGNSLVCHLLEIADVDPLRFGLSPDRFLHPDRTEAPDFDLEIDWRIRDRAIDDVLCRLGRDRTARLGSLVAFQPRSAFREAAKAHGLAHDRIDALAETLGPRLDAMLHADPHDLRSRSVPREAMLDPTAWSRILGDARRLLGRPHHLSMHPGGIAFAPDRLDGHVPLERSAKGLVVTQCDKKEAKEIGLLTLDIAGSRALGLADDLRSCGFADAPCRDEETAALLSRGDTLGIAQLESAPMRRLLAQLRPSGPEDVAAALALVRPGAAMDHAKETFVRRRRGLEIEAVPPPLAQALPGQHGMMIYEDDALGVLEAVAGFPIRRAQDFFDRLRRRGSVADVQALAEEFYRRTDAHDVPHDFAEEQFRHLLHFRRYALGKSRAASLGLLAWRAARQKARNPLAFWVAGLNNMQGTYPRRVHVEAAKQAGLRILAPCVHRSDAECTAEAGAVRLGLDAIVGLSAEVRERIAASRRKGPFRSIADFRQRVQPTPAAAALLSRCGALDCLAPSGRVASVAGTAPPAATLFPEEDLPESADAPTLARRFDELATLGFVVQAPTLSLFADILPPQRVRSSELPWHIGETVQVAGLLASARDVHGAEGKTLRFVTLQDEAGLIDLNLPPNVDPLHAASEFGPFVATGVVREELDAIVLQAHRIESCPAAESAREPREPRELREPHDCGTPDFGPLFASAGRLSSA